MTAAVDPSLPLAELSRMIRAAVRERRWGDTPIGEQVDAYLDALRYSEAAANTIQAYEPILGLFATEHADLTLADLEPPQGGGVVRAFLEAHWSTSSSATRRHRLAILRSFLAWLVGEGLLHANPATNIRGPKEKRRERRALSFDEVEALIASQPTLRDQVALSLLAFLGLRKDELRRLRVQDIDLDARTVLIHGKGGHEDKLPLAFERVADALRLYLLERQPEPEEFLLAPRSHPERPMDPATVHRWFKICLQRAGLDEGWAPHDLRRAAADALYAVTSDIVLAQQLLRHSDVRTTRGYLSPSVERLAAGMRQVETSRAAKNPAHAD